MLTPHSAICNVFVKVGGSILDNAPHTAALAEGLVSLPSGQRIVILTGGGHVAKRIKANQRERACDFESCWRATTLALDVNAGLLASHSTRFCVTSSIAQIMAAQEAGAIPIFAPAGALINSLWFTPNWIVTTDTMGLYFAHHMGAVRYIIVTDVDGVCERAPGPGNSVSPISKLYVAQLESLPSSKLDAAFPGFFRRYPLETMVVNGKYPGRVTAAIAGRRTLGTEIALDPEVVPLTGREVVSREPREVAVRAQSRALLSPDAAGSSASV
jgi:aspartokinase-like uncharacterized kinase